MHAKAMVGIGTLIVFIAGILVAAMAAGVTITTQMTLQNKALEVGSKARRGVSINFQTQDIRLIQNPTTLDYDTLEMVVKLGPGSEDVRLDKTLIDVISTNGSNILRHNPDNTAYVNKQAQLIYEEINTSTWTRAHTDLDFDFREDSIRVYNSTQLSINLTTEGIVNITVPSIQGPGAAIDQNFSIGTQFGTLYIQGTTTQPDTLDAGTVMVYPYAMYVGYGGFKTEFMLMHKEHREDIIVEGDVVRFTLRTQEGLEEEEELHVSIKKSDGQVHRVRAYLPDVIIGSRVRIYP